MGLIMGFVSVWAMYTLAWFLLAALIALFKSAARSSMHLKNAVAFGLFTAFLHYLVVQYLKGGF